MRFPVKKPNIGGAFGLEPDRSATGKVIFCGIVASMSGAPALQKTGNLVHGWPKTNLGTPPKVAKSGPWSGISAF